MNSRQSRRVLAALGLGIALTIAVGAASDAQDAPRGLPANPQSQGPAPDQVRPNPSDPPFDRRDGAPLARRGDRLERRLDFLHQRLRVTAAQEPVWEDFANVIRQETQAMRERLQDAREDFRGRQGDRGNDARRDDTRRPPPTVLNRLEDRQQTLTIESARIEHILRALRPLYGALDQTQKRTADRLFFRPDAEQGGFFNRRMPFPGWGGGFGPRFGFDGDPRQDFGRGY
jgi:periplasmic protein CpxP/Spy